MFFKSRPDQGQNVFSNIHIGTKLVPKKTETEDRSGTQAKGEKTRTENVSKNPIWTESKKTISHMLVQVPMGASNSFP